MGHQDTSGEWVGDDIEAGKLDGATCRSAWEERLARGGKSFGPVELYVQANVRFSCCVPVEGDAGAHFQLLLVGLASEGGARSGLG